MSTREYGFAVRIFEDVRTLVVEHPDRLARFGVGLIEHLLRRSDNPEATSVKTTNS